MEKLRKGSNKENKLSGLGQIVSSANLLTIWVLNLNIICKVLMLGGVSYIRK